MAILIAPIIYTQFSDSIVLRGRLIRTFLKKDTYRGDSAPDP